MDSMIYGATFEIIGDNTPTAFTFRKIIDKELHNLMLDITENEEFYNEEVTVSANDLEQFLPQITNRVQAGNEKLMPLAFILSDCFKQKIHQYECMKEDGKITFDHLSRMFTIGTKFVAVGKENQLVGSIVHNTRVQTGMFGEKYFVISGLFTFSNGISFCQKPQDFAISEFKGLKYPDTLNVRLMTPEDEVYLTQRGKKFLKYGLGVHYCSYTGTMFYKTSYGNVHFNANGRVMVDKIGHKSVNPNDLYPFDMDSQYRGGHQSNNQQSFTEIPDDSLYLTWPFVKGFSINAKRWGEMFVENLDEINFDDNAFDYLVLDEKRKRIAKSLVINSKNSFSDIISGKSGGCIFLLHGPPGTGKTLTCEAISELLHQPLYSITVGELGTTPEILEMKLTRILEMTKTWNAVILIDEADIFLEKRSENDIQRNAMVGIFLRLLERHTGVMFLTTNRAEQLDEAFRSRISVIFKYSKLDFTTKFQIWKNLLVASNCDINENEINELAQHEINGRQIKNAIRMAQSLAITDNAKVTKQYLDDVKQISINSAKILDDNPDKELFLKKQNELLGKISKPSGNDKSDKNEILIFISFSMPNEAIKQLLAESSKYKASLIIQGLVENSLPKTLTKSAELIKSANNQGGIQVDPNLFAKYKIKKVPAFVIKAHNRSDPEEFHVVYGLSNIDQAMEVCAKQNLTVSAGVQGVVKNA